MSPPAFFPQRLSSSEGPMHVTTPDNTVEIAKVEHRRNRVNRIFYGSLLAIPFGLVSCCATAMLANALESYKIVDREPNVATLGLGLIMVVSVLLLPLGLAVGLLMMFD